MKSIITSEVNEAFLVEAEKHGYRPYINHMKASELASTPDFYLGSVQKRLTDNIGTRYFIGIDMFDMSTLNLPRPTGPLATRAEVQFHRTDDGSNVVDVALEHDSFEETEAFFHRMWGSMSFGYYERTA